MSETTIWSKSPSLRSLVPVALLGIGLAWAGFEYAGPVAQQMINATADVIQWTETNVLIPYYGLQALGSFPLLLVMWRAIMFKTTRFSLTDSRILYNRGVLLRKYDQIRLERIRDFRILKPLLTSITGTGYILILSRDETYPQLTIGPFGDPLGVESAIRKQVLERQSEVGYREFETT